jgi:nucleolar protein 56
MIIQAIALADQLDKDVNTFSMRIREWYSWHFPELVKLIPSSPSQYARLVLLIGDKSTLDLSESAQAEKIAQIQEILDDDETMAKNVMDAAKSSMGSDINEVDLINIKRFAERVVQLADYRLNLRKYLVDKMNVVAPNLSALIGETIGARLISHAWVSTYMEATASTETDKSNSYTLTGVRSPTWQSTLLPPCKSSVPRRRSSERSRPRETLPR